MISAMAAPDGNPTQRHIAKIKRVQMWAEEKAGRPKLIFYGCFPEAHPSWMLVTHNAMEILFTPGWAPAHVAIPKNRIFSQ
jgi:hypothetical protein